MINWSFDLGLLIGWGVGTTTMIIIFINIIKKLKEKKK